MRESRNCTRLGAQAAAARVAATHLVRAVLILAALAVGQPAWCKTAATPALRIWFIDVEGGQSTLIVTPQGHSLLVDAGFAGTGGFGATPGDPALARDANRIVTAAHEAGIRRIDYLLITHFHADHDGGVPELAKLLPIRTFLDHGRPDANVDQTSPGAMSAFHDYESARGLAAHREPNVGDTLVIDGVRIHFVSSAGVTLTTALPGGGGPNTACDDGALPAGEVHENPRSTGFVLDYGSFRFLDVGDLTGQPLFELVCPIDRIGPVSAYLVAHHGSADAAVMATFAAFKPRVAIMNNGLHKGGAKETYALLHRLPAIEGVWQLHWSEAAAAENFSPEHIANPDESTADALQLTARRDGSFTVTNPRTGGSQAYR